MQNYTNGADDFAYSLLWQFFPGDLWSLWIWNRHRLLLSQSVIKILTVYCYDQKLTYLDVCHNLSCYEVIQVTEIYSLTKHATVRICLLMISHSYKILPRSIKLAKRTLLYRLRIVILCHLLDYGQGSRIPKPGYEAKSSTQVDGILWSIRGDSKFIAAIHVMGTINNAPYRWCQLWNHWFGLKVGYKRSKKI